MRKQRKRGQRRLAERWELRTSLDKEEVEKEEGKEEMAEMEKKEVVEKMVLAFLSPFCRTCCIDFISNVKLVNITIYV